MIMDGIQILSQQVIETPPGIGFYITWTTVFTLLLSLAFILVLFLISVLSDAADEWLGDNPRVAVAIILALAFVCARGITKSCAVSELYTTKETVYQVMIDEDVSLTEFYKDYEILEHNGLIYTIKERTDEAVD